MLNFILNDRKEAKKLFELDEDALISQLANSWIYLASVSWVSYNYCLKQIYEIIKGEKVQDAFFTFQEQSDKHQSTPLLLNNQAVCALNQGKFDEAQSLLQEALDKVSKKS